MLLLLVKSTRLVARLAPVGLQVYADMGLHLAFSQNRRRSRSFALVPEEVRPDCTRQSDHGGEHQDRLLCRDWISGRTCRRLSGRRRFEECAPGPA